MKKRLYAAILCLCMLVTFLPTTAFAVGPAAMTAGTCGISDGGIVYFGQYTEGGQTYEVPWLVLDADKTNTNAGGALLISKHLLGSTPFEALWDVDDNDGQTIPNEWQNSDAQDWCKNYAGKANFTDAELSTMLLTTKTDSKYLDYGASELNKEKAFFLSGEEAATYFDSDQSREAVFITHPTGSTGWWWLRSPYGDKPYNAGVVSVVQRFTRVSYADGARPALNLDISRVILTSAAQGGKVSGSVGAGALKAVSSVTPAEWKLTLLDSSRDFKAEKKEYNNTNKMMTITYSGATVGTNEYISTVVMDGSGNIKYYGNIEKPKSANGSAKIDLSGITLGADDKLCVFSEQVNGDKKTDYASALQEMGTSGSGSNSGTDIPPAKQTIPAGDGSVQVDYTRSGNTALIVLTDNKVKDIIASAKKNGEAVFDISKVANTAAAELPKTALSAMAEAGLDVILKLPGGTFTLDKDTVASIAKQAGAAEVKLAITKADTAKELNERQKAAVGDFSAYELLITSGDKKITGFDGGLLTASIPYTLKSGQNSDNVVVWYLDESGNVEKVKSMYDVKTKMVILTTNHLSLYVIGYEGGAEWVNPFTDVEANDWFYQAVKYVHEKGMMSGTSTAAFAPHAATTRGMIVTILYKMEGSPKISGNQFNDVAAGDYYANATAWVQQNNIVGGYGNGKFGPNDPITREQMATILMNYARFKGDDVTSKANLTQFKDSGFISGYAADAMAWANAEGLISGKSNDILDPKGNAERCQVASILMKFAENVVK